MQGERLIADDASLAWAIERPRSLFAHSLRRTRAGLLSRDAPAGVVVGITSALPGEGKTVVAANLARLAALQGGRVLLIDAAPYNAQLTKLLAPQASRGLSNAAAEDLLLDDVVLHDRWTDLRFLPGRTADAVESAETGGISAALEQVLPQIKSDYDLIVIDLPPLALVSDVQEAAHILDKVLLVVEWGRCRHEELAAALARCGPVRRKLAGAVLNKADTGALQSHAEDADVIAGADFADYLDDKERRLEVVAPLARKRDQARTASASAPDRTRMLLRPIQNGRSAGFEEGSKKNG